MLAGRGKPAGGCRAGSVSGGDDAIQGDVRQPLRGMYATEASKSRRVPEKLVAEGVFLGLAARALPTLPRALGQNILQPEELAVQARRLGHLQQRHPRARLGGVQHIP